jgi:phosphopentomutase
MPKAIMIILDSFGVGELPDAADFGDEGSDTLGHIAEKTDLKIPNMLSLGIGNIDGVHGVGPVDSPVGCYGKCSERQPGKDTTGGHWEIAGIILKKPFPTFHDGFPDEVVRLFREKTGLDLIGNYASSGTEIIKKLGDEHVRTGRPIVYTSADSVLQIAAHEEVIPLKRLYEICRITREFMQGEYSVGRIIARPFTGTSGAYKRTENRRDYSLKPPAPTVLDRLKEDGLTVAGVGKIEDIFAGQGLTKVNHTTNNAGDIEATIEYMQEDFDGLIFTNLVDFDMLYGHRNDTEGYARALMEFDAALPSIIGNLKPGDMLIITADHGCDPTTKSTDHSREYTPLLIYGPDLKRGVNLGIRSTFADIGATILDFFGLEKWHTGESFLPQLRQGGKI